jgi:hypothetical protein
VVVVADCTGALGICGVVAANRAAVETRGRVVQAECAGGCAGRGIAFAKCVAVLGRCHVTVTDCATVDAGGLVVAAERTGVGGACVVVAANRILETGGRYARRATDRVLVTQRVAVRGRGGHRVGVTERTAVDAIGLVAMTHRSAGIRSDDILVANRSGVISGDVVGVTECAALVDEGGRRPDLVAEAGRAALISTDVVVVAESRTVRAAYIVAVAARDSIGARHARAASRGIAADRSGLCDGIAAGDGEQDTKCQLRGAQAI